VTDTLPLPEPTVGSRWIDATDGRVVTYLGDHGHGPWFRDELTRAHWYCDWCDYYVWRRFRRVA
jgi:hypothetical protein